MPSVGIGLFDQETGVTGSGTTVTTPTITPTYPDNMGFLVISPTTGTVTPAGGWSSYTSLTNNIFVQEFLAPFSGSATISTSAQFQAALISFQLLGGAGLPSIINTVNQSGGFAPPVTYINPLVGTTAGNTIMFFSISTMNPDVPVTTLALGDTQGNTYNHIVVGAGFDSGANLDVWVLQNCPGGDLTFEIGSSFHGFPFATWESVGIEIPASIPNPIIFLQAVPSTISLGTSSTIQWATTYATDLTSNEFGEIPLSGSMQVTPTATDYYHFDATGPGGETTGVVEVIVSDNKAAFSLQKTILTMKQDRIPVRGKN
jgi:hypothetical protein